MFKQRVENKRLVGIILLTIVMFRFFSFIPITNNTIVKFTAMTMPILMLLMSYKQFLRDRANRFSSLVRGLIILVVVSMLSAFLFWQQSLDLSYRVTYVALSYIYFFYLVKCRYTIDEVELYIIVITITYVILWLIAHVANPIPLFGRFDDGEGIGIYDTEAISSRGFPRIMFVGSRFLPLTFFLFLIRYDSKKDKKYLLLSIGVAVVIFLHLTRGIIIGTLLAYLLYMFEKKSAMRWWIIILVSVLYVSPQLLEGTIAGNLIEETAEAIDTSEGDEKDIRILEYEFFFTDYNKNVATALIGSGVAHTTSEFGYYTLKIAEELRMFDTDVGYAQIYVYIGFIGLALFIVIWVKVLCLRDITCQYARYYLLAVMIMTIFQGYVFAVDGIISICVALYLLGIKQNLSYKTALYYEKNIVDN